MMKMENTTKWLIIVVIILLASNILNWYLLHNKLTLEENNLQNKFFYENGSRNNWNGYYKPYEKFYCVYTDDRWAEQIMKTDYHEMCHRLVDYNHQHFCK